MTQHTETKTTAQDELLKRATGVATPRTSALDKARTHKSYTAIDAHKFAALCYQLERELAALQAWQTNAVEDFKDLYVERDTLRTQLAVSPQQRGR